MRDLLAMARFLVDRWANGDICIAVPADVSHWYSYWDRQDASLVLVWFIRSLSGWCWIGCVQLMSSSSSSRIKRASLPSLSVTIYFSSPADWRRGLRLTTRPTNNDRINRSPHTASVRVEATSQPGEMYLQFSWIPRGGRSGTWPTQPPTFSGTRNE